MTLSNANHNSHLRFNYQRLRNDLNQMISYCENNIDCRRQLILSVYMFAVICFLLTSQSTLVRHS